MLTCTLCATTPCRFSQRVYVPLPDRTTRAALIRTTMGALGSGLCEQEYLQVAGSTAKYSGRDLVQVCRWGADGKHWLCLFAGVSSLEC